MPTTYTVTSVTVTAGEVVDVVNGGQTVPVAFAVAGGTISNSTVPTNYNGEPWLILYVPSPTGGKKASKTSESSGSALVPSITSDPTAVTDYTKTGSSSSGPVESSADAIEPSSPGKGIQGGAVAGVAIGCLIAGLALGLLVAFIIFRRHRRNNSTSPNFIAVEPQYAEPKHGPQVSVTTSGQDAELSQFLLDSTPDKEIQSELSSLSELIYQHVETYYHGPQVQATSAEVAQSLVNIGYSPELSGIQPEAVAAICLAPKTSKVGLRHVLSHVIFRGLDFNSGGNLSMLPLPVAAMARENQSENTDSPGKTTLISVPELHKKSR
ncbi:hypothetical protein NW752_002600 [Fusarium irregulare]|uniref:Uncharacterized protein n=1 Tax=Fusarium irregulare TaxID=2494466 RepID=A0A9W8Q0L2_9HYPO|nr:hypothetical protein NW766_000264 [Fusarium irregulare]KAJ4025134.1 hypothetical protein NW752_002600 [Fusarium irregulare]